MLECPSRPGLNEWILMLKQEFYNPISRPFFRRFVTQFHCGTHDPVLNFIDCAKGLGVNNTSAVEVIALATNNR